MTNHKQILCLYCGHRIKKFNQFMPGVWKGKPAHISCFKEKITEGEVCNTCSNGTDGMIYIFCNAPERGTPPLNGGFAQSMNHWCDLYLRGKVNMKFSKEEIKKEWRIRRIEWKRLRR